MSARVVSAEVQKHDRRRALSDISISLVLGSLVSTFVLGRLIAPQSLVGRFVFWPQDFLSFLRFSSDSSLAPRLMFAAIVFLLSCSTWVALNATGVSRSGQVRKLGYVVLAITAPMLCWVVVKSQHFAWAGAAVTFIYILAALWFSSGRWALHVAFWHVSLILWLAWWVYLFRRELDPIMLSVPIFSFCAVLFWTLGDAGASAKKVA